MRPSTVALVFTLALGLLVAPLAAEAQQAGAPVTFTLLGLTADRQPSRSFAMSTTSCSVTDESVEGPEGPEDAYRVIRAGAADILNVYVSEAGGLRSGVRIVEIARAAGLQCTIGSRPELGIGAAARAHLGVSVPALSEPADVCGFLYHAESLIEERWEVRDAITAPEGPGPGVTLDEARLAARRID